MEFLNFLVLSILLVAQINCCPPAEDIAPLCFCKEIGGDKMMICENVLSPEQLISPMKSVVMHNIKLFALTIQKSSLMYVPDGIFEGTSLEKIRFYQTEVLSLTDMEFAFRGLEESLTEIRATEAPYAAQWDWNTLRNLKRMKLIDINDMLLSSVDHEFPLLPELTHLGLINAEISFVVDSAFSNLPMLSIINMKKNAISELKRNMFPDPAENLFLIDLSDNELSHLPEDFFSNMPSLSHVHLDRNKFTTLGEKPFSGALKTVEEFTISGNNFRCDCRMRWMVSHRFPSTFRGACTSPENLKDVSLKYLDSKSLWCY